MLGLETLNTDNFSNITTAAITGLTGVSYIQFEPHKSVPYDDQAAPVIRIIGYGLVGLALYSAWRSYMLWNVKDR